MSKIKILLALQDKCLFTKCLIPWAGKVGLPNYQIFHITTCITISIIMMICYFFGGCDRGVSFLYYILMQNSAYQAPEWKYPERATDHQQGIDIVPTMELKPQRVKHARSTITRC